VRMSGPPTRAEVESTLPLPENSLHDFVKYHVLPIDDRSVERMDPMVAGRPDLMPGRSSLTLYPRGVGMAENVFINVKNRSHAITAVVDVPKGGANGVIVAQGGRFGGWSLYLKEGKPTFDYKERDNKFTGRIHEVKVDLM
jgi:hypothetical protein